MSKSEKLAQTVREFVTRDFGGAPAARTTPPAPHPLWTRLHALGTELWLDTGSLEESAALWNAEFKALTTNNTLLNREVQNGQYDALMREADALLEPFHLSTRERLLEIAFILNAVHGLRLVRTYDAWVSVEEHTDLAHDVEASVRYAVRFHEICPERFIVKIPFTPAGLLATRRLSDQGIAVNHTLGFSARQNYVIARVARPAFVNVFLGRLSSFAADNHLGDGKSVGEKATWASQAVIRELRRAGATPARQIGASLRSGEQVRDLAGLDVLTMPPKAASQFLELKLAPASLRDKSAAAWRPRLAPGVDPDSVRLETLWEVEDRVVNCVEKLMSEDLSRLTADGLIAFFATHGCADLLPNWTPVHRETSVREGKIPIWRHWKDTLTEGVLGLDSVLNLGGLTSFIADQRAMDGRVGRATPKK